MIKFNKQFLFKIHLLLNIFFPFINKEITFCNLTHIQLLSATLFFIKTSKGEKKQCLSAKKKLWRALPILVYDLIKRFVTFFWKNMMSHYKNLH